MPRISICAACAQCPFRALAFSCNPQKNWSADRPKPRIRTKYATGCQTRELADLNVLIQLTHASRVSSALAPDDLESILAASQRNNQRVGITGALYHRILLDPRHRDPAILDFCEIASRKFTQWSMGSLASLESNRTIYLKYSRSSSFDPYGMSQATLQSFFDEVMANGTWIG